MKEIHYVSRCKYGPNSDNNETYSTIHGASTNETFCGKALNEMWYVLSSAGMNFDDITCKKCLRALKETENV